MAMNPWKKLYANVKLVSKRHNGYGHAFTGEDATLSERPVNITWEDLKEQFENQGRKCYWFGIELTPSDVFKSGYPLSMSVDRLDNNRGYEKDNIVITSRLANLGRGRCDTETFLNIVKKLQLPNESLPHNHFFGFNI